MRFFTGIVLLTGLLLVAGCESSLDRRYLDTSLGKPLELPPDLSQFEAESNFDLPGGYGDTNASGLGKPPVLANIDSLQLQGSGDLYWLSVAEPAEDLYQLVKNFWAFEGYGLVVDEPVIGVMQTEWIYTEEGVDNSDVSWWESFFTSDDLSATQDQFHTRIERDVNAGVSRIYIAHRGTEYQHVISTGNESTSDLDNTFQFRNPEPELEVEMLSRLMIYLGLQQGAVDEQLAGVKLFKPRARMEVDSEEKSPYLLLLDPYQIAWNRVQQTLLRMNFEIEASTFKSGLSEEGDFIVRTEVADGDQDEGFFSFLGSGGSSSRRFILVLSEETHEITRLVIEDEKGNFDTTPEGAEFLSLLFEEVK